MKVQRGDAFERTSYQRALHERLAVNLSQSCLLTILCLKRRLPSASGTKCPPRSARVRIRAMHLSGLLSATNVRWSSYPRDRALGCTGGKARRLPIARARSRNHNPTWRSNLSETRTTPTS